MLNKLKFNNLVISNKNGIQQSRTQTINKLVRKIRSLKTLLEKHPDNTKCKERIRKSTETMELLKKIKRVDIMKKVLLMDKPAPAIITNGLASPEEVGVALLSMNNVMQGLIKRFRAELQINEAKNDEWKEVLMESSKRKQKIERTEEKRRRRLEMKQQKAMGRKRQEWLEENQSAQEEGAASAEKNLSESTAGGWEVEELSNDFKTKDEDQPKVTDKKITQQIKRKENPLPKKSLPTNKKQKIIKEIEESYIDSDENTESKQEEDQNCNVSKPIKEKIYQEAQRESSPEPEEEAEEDLVVDPFFITDTGENYLSTAVIKRDQNADDENNSEKRDLHLIKLNNYDKKANDFTDRRQQARDKNQRDFTQNRQQNNKWSNDKGQQNRWNNNHANGGRDKFSQNRFNDKGKQDFKNKNASNNSAEPKLHPSWAAKQKLKPTITGFQGKKITFGDDNISSEKPKQSQFQSNKPATPKPSKIEKYSIHPSWAAKQKLKPTISAFQGKKITFDE